MAENVVDVSVNDGACVVRSNGTAAPIVATVENDVCTVYVLATNGKPFATMKVIDKETGEEIPVNVYTCAEAVTCNAGIPMQTHLQNLYAHAEDDNAHLTAEEKVGLETQAGAQAKADSAKDAAIAASSLEIAAATAAANAYAEAKATAARDAAYRYADGIGNKLTAHKEDTNNPHGVTAEQVGLGNVPNKATNDLQPTYTEAGTLEALTNGERLSIAFGKLARGISELIAHIGNKANPHEVTASQVGLGNVPNKATNDLTPTYTEASSIQALTSGEKLSASFGKIAKAVSSLISHIANKNNPHVVTASQTGAVPAAGGTMTGALKMDGGDLILKEGVNYGTELPEPGIKGRLFFKKVSQ